jgi:parallel beta-helix repeat protein
MHLFPRSTPAVGAFGAALVALMAFGAGPASATHVSCGQTIHTDTKLDSDLIDCPGDGVVIGGNNITLDLNGHTIDGMGNGTGVLVRLHDGVQVKNGTIRQFFEGVGLSFADNNRLDRLAVSENGFGIRLARSDGNRLERNEASDNGSGIVLTVDVGAGPSKGSDSNVLVRNSAFDNAGDGIALGGSGLNRLERNEASDNGSDGIELGEAFAGPVPDISTDNLLIRNRASRNEEQGIVLNDNSSGNRLLENRTSSNGGGIAMLSGSDNNQLMRNLVSDNQVDGVFVSAESNGTVLQRNGADENGDDGIDVESPNTTLTGNSANRNFDLGIEAVPGVTDGGGNRAKGNGNPAQCQNVSCSP